VVVSDLNSHSFKSSSINAEKARDLPKTSASGKFPPEPLPNVRKRLVAAAA
jgi:hypothetical protein